MIILPSPVHEPVRNNDPKTSHQGARDVKMRANGQKVKLLVAYGSGQEMNPYHAAVEAGIDTTRGACYWRRCTDLEQTGLIEKTGRQSMGNAGSLRDNYRITDRGLSYLQRHS